MPLRKPSTAHPRILSVYSPPLAALERAATMRARGAIAQLGERLDRTQEVGGSSPPSSITDRARKTQAPVYLPTLGQ